MKKDLHSIRPYGDHLDDGRMQLSFTLPVPAGPEAKEAARLYVEKMGLTGVDVVWMESMGGEFTWLVVYGQATPTVDFTKIRVPRPEFPCLSFEELMKLAREKVRKRIVVVGGTTGSDAHTVGIDAILSIKGIKGDKGLEYYPFFRVINLRAQVDNRDLVQKAVENQADAILVSKLVTQQDQHLKDLRELARLLRDEKRLPRTLLKLVGGPRMDHATARKIGFDAGFGPGTKPSEVANYIVHELTRRSSGDISPKGQNSPASPPKRRSLFGWLSGD